MPPKDTSGVWFIGLLVLILAVIGIGVFELYAQYQAYTQAIKLAGGEPDFIAFIGWMTALNN